MKPIISAIRTLTTFPIPGKDTENFASAIPFFPLAGLLLSIFPVGIFFLFNHYQIEEWGIAALISLFLTTYFTGFLHVDGLGDVADAFGGGKNKEKILEILKDSRMGTYGISAIVFDLLFKLYLWTWALKSGYYFIIILSLMLGRASQMLFLNFMKSARVDGIASAFIKTDNIFKILSISSILIVLIPFYFMIAPLKIVITLFSSIFIVFATAFYFNLKIQGITGDCLGTINEITEITVILAFLLSSLFCI